MAKKPLQTPGIPDDLLAKAHIAKIESFAIRPKNWDGHNCEPLPKHIAVAAANFIKLIQDYVDERGDKRHLPTQSVYHTPNMPDRNGNIAYPNGLMMGWVLQNQATGKLEVIQSIIFWDKDIYYSGKNKLSIGDMFSKELATTMSIIDHLPVLAKPTVDDSDKIKLVSDFAEGVEKSTKEIEDKMNEGTIYDV